MRRTYRYDKRSERMVEVRRDGPAGAHIIEDAYYRNPTISPIDGTLISSRAELKAHEAKHGVVALGAGDCGLTHGGPAPAEVTERELSDAYDQAAAQPERVRALMRSRHFPGDGIRYLRD